MHYHHSYHQLDHYPYHYAHHSPHHYNHHCHHHHHLSPIYKAIKIKGSVMRDRMLSDLILRVMKYDSLDVKNNESSLAIKCHESSVTMMTVTSNRRHQLQMSRVIWIASS